MKSPEISHVLPQLAAAFPGARFVLVFRPLVEIAESMYRMGNTVKRVAVFHRRWQQEGVIPPGVPVEWESLWCDAKDFQRCVIYGASYLRAISAGIEDLGPESCFVYDHAELRRCPARTMTALARFLDLRPLELKDRASLIKRTASPIPLGLRRTCRRLVRELDLGDLRLMLERRAYLSLRS